MAASEITYDYKHDMDTCIYKCGSNATHIKSKHTNAKLQVRKVCFNGKLLQNKSKLDGARIVDRQEQTVIKECCKKTATAVEQLICRS